MKPTAYEGSNLRELQLLLWMGQKLMRDAPNYNLAFTFEIDGEIDPLHLGRAIRALIERSDAMRTVIEEIDGVPRQRVLEELKFDLEFVDLSGTRDTAGALRTWVERRAQQVFRLDERLFDTALLRVGPGRFVWFFNQHHLSTDGWSYALTFRHVGELYRLSREGRIAEAPHLPSFLDWVAREREGVAALLETSAEAARGENEPLHFYGREDAEKSGDECRVTRRLGVERTARLRSVATREDLRSLNLHLSLLTSLCALLLVYLYRATGARRLTIGVPFHNRMQDEDRDVMGLVQEMYPVEIEVSDEDTFASLVRKAGKRVWSALRRSRSRRGPVQRPHEVLLNYPNVSFAEFDGHPTRARWQHTGHGDGNRALFLQVQDFDAEDDLILHFDLNEGVFDAGLREVVPDHFINVLDRFLENPNRPVSSIELITEQERSFVVQELNATDAEYPASGNLADLFENSVRDHADREALVFGDRSLTYAELNKRANRLAHHLRGRGIGAGSLVASCVERSEDAIVGLLAILKSGAAYVPLDPTYPKDRLGFMLSDSGAPVLLTQQRLVAELPDHQAEVVCLDTLDADLAGASEDDPTSGAAPGDLGYVIYTSGSTGKPKGVAMSQRALVNLVWWQVRQPTPVPRARTLQFTPLTFDVSLQETLSTWCAGGTLVLIPEETRRDPEATLRLIDEAGIERLFIIFTPFQKIAEAADRVGLVPRALREVITAGEQLRVTPSVARFFERLPDCTLHNQYGPSETHIVTAHTLEGPPAEWPRLPPIGRPIANTQTYVLDAEMRPVPLGAPGELYIGGAQVAEGYLQRPELTAERFVPDPFRGASGERLYRSGDLARLLPDGNIEFLGRMDHQIKLRGYRIELGEIETVLVEHPEVREATVVAREDGGEKRLVGYVVLTDAAAGANGKLAPRLREFLAEKLPEPMVPSAFVVLSNIPQTPNGKVDRRALPAPGSARPELDQDYVAPVDETQRAIAEVWKSVLGIDRVGLCDNFFDLGGHSLLLVDVHDVLRDRLAGSLGIVDLFRYPTVESLSRFVTGGGAANDDLRRARDRAERQKEMLARQTRPGRAPGGE